MGALPIGRNGRLEILVLLAGDQADAPQAPEVLLRLRQVVDHEVGLTHVLVGSAMARIELERAPVMIERALELARVTVRVAQVVLDIGVSRVTQRGGGERLDSGLPLLR